MSEADENLPAPTGGLPAALGIELLEAEGETARGRIEVSERTLQPYGIVHGGVYAALAETVASAATAHARRRPTASLRSASRTTRRSCARSPQGHIEARASARHSGRTTWVWDVDMSDDDGRICAISRVVVAVREPRA